MENLTKRPSKGILKSSSSIERQDSKLTRQNSQDRDLKWDEMNILQTLHPADKDYGHMKIEEPKTPFSYYNEDDVEINSDHEETKDPVDPNNLAELLTKKTKDGAFSFDDHSVDMEELEAAEDWNDLTEEEKQRRVEFESKRKKHYNEFQMVRLARKLMEEEMQEENDEETNNGPSSASAPNATSDAVSSTTTTDPTKDQTPDCDDISKV